MLSGLEVINRQSEAFLLYNNLQNILRSVINSMELAKKFSTTKPSGMVRVFQAIEKMTDVLNLSIGEPDFVTEPESKRRTRRFHALPPTSGLS